MPKESIKLLLIGDVMIGRGVDQILEYSVPWNLNERKVRDARTYIKVSERANGPIPPAEERFAMGPGRYVWGDFLPAADYENPDVRLINLETALTFSEDQEPKNWVHRGHPGNAYTVLVQAGKIDGTSVANNHVGDFGMAGMVETLATLKAVGVVPVGLGMNEDEAFEAKMITDQVGMIALVSGGTGAPDYWQATPTSPGVARCVDEMGPRDLARTLRSLAAVSEGRSPTPLLVASMHIGPNWSHKVNPHHRWFAQQITDPTQGRASADIVCCHSSHHVKGFEVSEHGKLFLWGLGDVVNDYEGTPSGPGFLKEYCLTWFPTFDLVNGDWKFSKMRMRVYRVRKMTMNNGNDEEANALLQVLQEHSFAHNPNQTISFVMKKDKFGIYIDASLKTRSKKTCVNCW